MKRKSIPKKVEKLIFQETNSTCPFCGENDVNTLEIHHILPLSEGGTDEPGNLILACSNCHNKITNGAIFEREVFQKKLQLMSGGVVSKPPKNQGNISLVDSVNKGVIAQSINTVNIKTPRRKITIPPPTGSIGSDLDKKNYAKYLIDRYLEFKKVAVGKKSMNYAIFYSSIKKEFGAKWDHVPLANFERLCIFLKKRIDNTILGKNKKSRGQKSYSSFEEFKNK